MSGVRKEFRKQKCCETVKTSRDSSEDEEARSRDDDLERSRNGERSLVHEKSQNHNEMTERSGSGNAAEVWKLVKDICRCGKKNLLANKVSCKGKAENLEVTEIQKKRRGSRVSLGKRAKKQHTKNRYMDRATSTLTLRWTRAPRQIEMITD